MAALLNEVEVNAGFAVSLGNFEGPFDLLLNLISKHQMDITEVSLSRVTDEFIAYLKGLDDAEEMEQASEFLVVAATLLDLKIASLLPKGEVVDPEDLAAFEARDLLFARLLQYRAFKEIAAWFNTALTLEARRIPREVRLEARCLAILELFRMTALSFEQESPLGELTLTWRGDTFDDKQLETLGAEYDS